METLPKVEGPQTYNSRSERPNPDFQNLIYVYAVASDSVLSGERHVQERIGKRQSGTDGFHAKSYGIRLVDESGRFLTWSEAHCEIMKFFDFVKKYSYKTFWVHDFSGLSGCDYLVSVLKVFVNHAPSNCYIPQTWLSK